MQFPQPYGFTWTRVCILDPLKDSTLCLRSHHIRNFMRHNWSSSVQVSKDFAANTHNITVRNGALCIWESGQSELFVQQLVLRRQCRLTTMMDSSSMCRSVNSET